MFYSGSARSGEVRYARSEGGAVAYQAVGDESLDLVFLAEWMNNLEMQWNDPRLARFPNRLSTFHRVLMLNMRDSEAAIRARNRALRPPPPESSMSGSIPTARG